MDLLVDTLERIRKVLTDESKKYFLHEPSFDNSDQAIMKDVIESGFVSSVGKYVDEFERKLAEVCERKYAVACVNGTSALHICLLLAGLKPGEEVLMPSLTFVATANAVNYVGATPHFIDVSLNSLCVDVDLLSSYLEKNVEKKKGRTFNPKTGKRISALIVMNAYGHIDRIDELNEICKTYNIQLVEDAAESLGSLFKGSRNSGTCEYSAVSFNGNKIITTGGGGAILTDNEEVKLRAKHLTTTAKVAHPYKFHHDTVGYNYRMPNLNAALGVAQLEKLPRYLEQKQKLAQSYERVFADSKFLSFVRQPKDCQSNYWLVNLVLEREYSEERDKLIEYLHNNNIFVRPTWELMSRLPMYNSSPSASLSNSQDLVKRIISLPSSPFLEGA